MIETIETLEKVIDKKCEIEEDVHITLESNSDEFPQINLEKATSELTTHDINGIYNKFFGFENLDKFIYPHHDDKVQALMRKQINLEVMNKYYSQLKLTYTDNNIRFIDLLNRVHSAADLLSDLNHEDDIFFSSKDELLLFKEIYSNHKKLVYIRQHLTVMFNARSGAYSFKPFICNILSYIIIGAAFGDYFDENQKYRELYLNLILSGSTFLGFLLIEYGKGIRAYNKYMRLHYKNMDDLMRLCYQHGFIKKIGNDFFIGDELEIMQYILFESWRKALDYKVIDGFARMDHSKVMDISLNVFKSLCISIISIKNQEQALNLTNEVLSKSFKLHSEFVKKAIDSYSGILIKSLYKSNGFYDIISCHYPGYVRFVRIPSIAMFQVALIEDARQFYTTFFAKGALDDSGSDVIGSATIKIRKSRDSSRKSLAAFSIADGLLVNDKAFYEVYDMKEDRSLGPLHKELSDIMKKVQKPIFEQAGLKPTLKAPHIITLLASFIAGIPIFKVFDNVSSSPWFKIISASVAFIIVGILTNVSSLINKLYYKYNQQYKAFSDTILKLVHDDYIIPEYDAESNIVTAVTCPENFKVYMYIIASSINAACMKKNVNFSAFKDEDKALIVINLFNALARLMMVEVARAKPIVIDYELASKIIKHFSAHLEKCMLSSLSDRASRIRLTGHVIKKFYEQDLAKILVNELNDLLDASEKQIVLSGNSYNIGQHSIIGASGTFGAIDDTKVEKRNLRSLLNMNPHANVNLNRVSKPTALVSSAFIAEEEHSIIIPSFTLHDRAYANPSNNIYL